DQESRAPRLQKFWGAKSCTSARFCLWKSVAGGVGEDEADGVGDVVELQSAGLAEVVAVDLVRERGLVLDHELVEVDLLVETPGRLHATPAQRPGDPAEQRRGPQRAERDRHQAA